MPECAPGPTGVRIVLPVLARLYTAQEQPEVAVALLQRLLEIEYAENPGSEGTAKAAILLARTLLALGDVDKARTLLLQSNTSANAVGSKPPQP